MRRILTFVALLAAFAAAPGPADAIGFVRGGVTSQLGQPLDFTAVVRVEPDETIARECIVADVTPGDVRLPGAAVRVNLQPGRAPNERILRVTTSVTIDEPVVNVEIVIGCTARLTRSFVAFVDPPALNLATAAPAADTPAPVASEPAAARSDSAAAPAVAAAREAAAATAAPPSSPPPRRVVRTAPPRSRAAAEARAVAPSDTPRPRAPAVAARPAPSTGARLQLEPAEPVVARAPAAASAPAAAPAVAAAPVAPAASTPEQLAAELAANQQAQRIAGLEASVAKLRADAEAAQARSAALQAELAAARAGGGDRLLVLLLGALAAVLALVALLLWLRQRRPAADPGWWVPQTPAAPASPTVAPAPAPAFAATPSAAMPLRDGLDTLAEIRTPPPTRPVAEPAPAPEAPTPPRELSVEELIDLEQQADFFVVLGQDEAAIDLLTSHVRSSGGTSPLPFLKLLEIYRRRGDRESYERTRDRFNRRFTAYAPEWGADLALGKGLEDYPDVIERLVQAWPAPAQVMEAMDGWIFRRDTQARTFDLPAYREVLFLYAIARDLLQSVAPPEPAPPPVPRPGDRVDFVLPSDMPPPSFAEQTLPLLADEPEAYRPTVVPTQMLRVDIDLTEPAGPESDFSGLIDPSRRG